MLIDDFISLGKSKKQLSWTASNLIPLIGEYKGNCIGKGMLLSGRRGQLFNWSPFFNEEGNYNVSVVGKSGSGKSFFMQELIVALSGSGCKVFVIDDGYSFEQTLRILGGDFVEFSTKRKLSINPFSIIDERKFNTDSDYRSSITSFIINILSQMARNDSVCSEEEKKDLEKAIEIAWNKKGKKCDIDSIIEVLASDKSDNRKNNLSHLLHSFSKKGVYGEYFQGSSAININQSLLGFELSEVKTQKHLQKVIMLTIMFLISESIYRGGREDTAIVIDEAWDLIGGGEMAIFMEGLARRIRKYGGSIIFGTQSVNDFYKNKASQACFENSDWRIFLPQKPESIDLLKQDKKLSINEYQENILRNIKKSNQFSELVISGPDTFTVGRLICDPYSIMLYSSKAEHFQRKKELIDSGMSVAAAIEQAKNEFFN